MSDLSILQAAAAFQAQMHGSAAKAAAAGLYATATAMRKAGDTMLAEAQSKLTVAMGGAPAAPGEPPKPKVTPSTHLALVGTTSDLEDESA